MVQRNAMRVWESGEDFMETVMQDEEIAKYLTKEEISSVFDLNYHLTHVDDIFDRVFVSA